MQTRKTIIHFILRHTNPKCRFWAKYFLLRIAISVNPRNGWFLFKLSQALYSMRSSVKFSHDWAYYIDRAIEVDRDFFFENRRKVFNIFLLDSNISDMEKYMQKFEDVQSDYIKAHGFDKFDFRFCSAFLFSTYNASAYLDTYLKAMELGLKPKNKLFVLLPKNENIKNPYMLEVWGRFITVIRDEETIELFSKIRKYVEYDIDYACSLNGIAMYIEHARVIVQNEWEARGLKPLLDISSDGKEFGWGLLEQHGIEKGRWFVSLHVRDSGYLLGSHGIESDPNKYRNADIDTYMDAVRSIVKRGGYVIRVGDPNMKPIPPMDGLFDYAHSSIRSNKMDIFLFSQCRFFIATNSGPLLVPCIFGVPVVITNLLPVSQRPWTKNTFYLPKLLWLNGKNRYATFGEILSSEIGVFHSTAKYQEKNIRIVDNTAAEINEVTVEMLDHLDGCLEYAEEDDEAQAMFNKVYARYGRYGIKGRMGRKFLEKYKNLCVTL